MWILALCLFATPAVGWLVWYLRRRWQWWMLYAAKNLLRSRDAILIQRYPLATLLWGYDIDLEVCYTHYKEDGLRTFRLYYGYYDEVNVFVFSSSGHPRWRWICRVGETTAEVAIPKFARRMLEDILDLVDARLKAPLAHPEAKIKPDDLPMLVGSDAA